MSPFLGECESVPVYAFDLRFKAGVLVGVSAIDISGCTDKERSSVIMLVCASVS